MFNSTSQETASTTGRVKNLFSFFGVDDVGNKLGYCSWCVEFSAFTRTLQFFQNVFIQLAKSMTVFCNIEIYFVQLVQHLANVNSAFHIVVVSFKNFTNYQCSAI